MVCQTRCGSKFLRREMVNQAIGYSRFLMGWWLLYHSNRVTIKEEKRCIWSLSCELRDYEEESPHCLLTQRESGGSNPLNPPLGSATAYCIYHKGVIFLTKIYWYNSLCYVSEHNTVTGQLKSISFIYASQILSHVLIPKSNNKADSFLIVIFYLF